MKKSDATHMILKRRIGCCLAAKIFLGCGDWSATVRAGNSQERGVQQQLWFAFSNRSRSL